jgi:uncharacterized membrane protein YbhN (UPF0104 family)
LKERMGGRKSSKTTWVSVVFGFLGAGALAWYLVVHSSELYRLRTVSVGSVSILSLLVLVTLGLSALRLRLMVTVFDAHISLLESFALTATGGLINFLPLNTAQVFRAIYLRKVRGLKLVEFGLGSGVVVFTDFVSAGILGLIALYQLYLSGENLPFLFLELFLIFILGPFAILGLTMIFRRSRWGKLDVIQAKKSWVMRAYLSLIHSLDIILKKPKIVARLFVVGIFSGIVRGLRFWFAATLLGYPGGFSSGVVLQSVSSATSLFTMMPVGAIGLREAMIGAGTKGLGREVLRHRFAQKLSADSSGLDRVTG